MSAKITPLPWGIYEDETIEIFGNNELSSVCTMQFANEEEKEMAREEAKTIVSAVNGTWGAGINPEVVPDLLESLKETLAQFKKIDMHYSKDHEIMSRAEAAIEKATIKP
jgi:hypothetical protein